MNCSFYNENLGMEKEYLPPYDTIIILLLNYEKHNLDLSMTLTSCHPSLNQRFINEILYMNFVREFHGNSLLVYVQCTDVSTCQFTQILYHWINVSLLEGYAYTNLELPQCYLESTKFGAIVRHRWGTLS